MAVSLRKELFRSILRQDIAFFDEHKSGEIVSRLTADIQDFDDAYQSPELMKELLNYTFANHMITKSFKAIGPLANNPFGQRGLGYKKKKK